MTCLGMLPAVGQLCWLECNGLQVTVRVADVKQAYGATRFRVVPVCGNGSIWVQESRLRVCESQELVIS